MAGTGPRRSVWMDVDPRSVAEFEKAIREGMKAWGVTTEQKLVRAGLTIQNRARQLCPVDTGRLRSSIMTTGLQHDSKGPFVEVGTNVEYAPYVEFGTSRMRARPFLRTAFLETLTGWGK